MRHKSGELQSQEHFLFSAGMFVAFSELYLVPSGGRGGNTARFRFPIQNNLELVIHPNCEDKMEV